MPNRYLALALPRLSTDRIARSRWGRSWRSTGRPDAPPIVVSRRDNNTRRIAALDEMAEAAGLRRGQGIADARAIAPAIEVLEEDEAADRRLLEGVADWCDRYTPLVALDAPDGLYLDIAGCCHLFGGERRLIDDLLMRLFEQGLDARAAIASTPGAAFAVARFGAGDIVAPGDEAAALAALPVAALRLDAQTIAGLDRVGLKHIGDLAGQPRAPLARRFGRQLMLRLDQALGAVEEPVSPRLPAPALIAERRLAEPVSQTHDIERLLELLAQNLREGLERRGTGARQLRFTLFRVDGAVSRLDVAASRPLRDPTAILRLYRERLTGLGDEIDAGFGFEALRLSVMREAPFAATQADLAGDDAEASEALADLADRVAARLGTLVMTCRPVESHLPERAVRLTPFEAADARPAPAPSAPPAGPGAERPTRMLAAPEPVEAVAGVPEGPPLRFRWRRRLHQVRAAEGPERIAGEWWRSGCDTRPRDYYRVEDVEGRRFWLFREGLFGPRGDGAAPRWFMHGLFA
ncbi:MAG TPA: DNA polymerase Y family protein [Rhizobiaceae bacterium]|nr:DNA polymerase Y family protein [Rhizobiaceae bacterium]